MDLLPILTQVHKIGTSLEELTNIKLETQKKLDLEYTIKEEKLTSLSHNKEFYIQKKKNKLQELMDILKDTQEQYWRKEDKYKFPRHITEYNNNLQKYILLRYTLKNDLLDVLQTMREEQKKIAELSDTNFQKEINIIEYRNELQSITEEIPILQKELKANFNRKKIMYDLHLDLLSSHSLKLKIELEKDNQNKIDEIKDVLDSKLETVSKIDKEIITYKREISLSLNSQDKNRLELNLRNLELKKSILEKEMFLLKESKEEQLVVINEIYAMKLVDNQDFHQDILRKIEYYQKLRDQKEQYILNQKQELELTITNELKVIENNKQQIEVLENKKIETDIKLEQLNSDVSNTIRDIKLLENRIDMAQLKSIKRYKYYMNFYTSDISELKKAIYIIKRDIDNLDSKKIETKLENDRINILKVILQDINKRL